MSGHHQATTGATATAMIDPKLRGYETQAGNRLFTTDARAFRGHRTLHQQHREQRRQHGHGQQQKNIEISK